MDWKKAGKALLFPPVWLTMLLTLISAVCLTVVFVKGWEQTIFAYIIFALSFYTLVALTCFFAVVLPRHYKQIRKKLYANPLSNRYMTDRAFRTEIALYLSLSFNLLYVAVNIWSWHLSHSWWFVVLAAYYTVMALMRFLLVRYMRKNQVGQHIAQEWKRARLCAAILLLINLSLSGAVLMILYLQRGYDYPGILIYVMALYSFYSVTHAVIDIVKFHALGSPIMSTAKIVSLSAALVSLLNLETAMFAQFGAEMPQQDQNLMVILTGAGISIIVVTLSVGLMVKATIQLRSVANGK